MIGALTDLLKGKAPLGVRRSSRWPAVRKAHILAHPTCEVCGGTTVLAAHHIEPFHLRPSLELEPSNLMTLCERKGYGINCHLLVGHLGNYKRINRDSVIDAAVWKSKLTGP
jgi:hypothetical protein